MICLPTTRASLFILLTAGILLVCSKPVAAQQARVRSWVTSPDGSLKLTPVPVTNLQPPPSPQARIRIADSTFQTIDGFGYTLTGSSARLMHQMSRKARKKLLHELFGNHTNALKISYLRISIGASDLSPEVFSYLDLPPGTTDTLLKRFSLHHDEAELIPLLREILKIRPDLKVMATPWSAPAWMKDNGSSIGGHLLPEFYPTYARYLLKYLQGMAERGISIAAITPQNEPEHGGNNPSMLMTAAEQATFIRDHLGPVLRSAGFPTKIILWDHNCDRPDYPISILNDSLTKAYVDGTAFHLYAGDISALSAVHEAHPDRNLYFTEQWTGAKGDFGGDLQWHIKNVLIGSMRNWSRIALEWNLANDPDFRLHTPGGCSECKGALTITGDSVERNVSYYIIGHLSRFVPPGSVRIGSNLPDNLPNAAFMRPDGKKVLLVLNEGSAPAVIEVRDGKTFFYAILGQGQVRTFLW